ncbi:unnamed protein product [Orchesella dallaii]|uniref:Protein quiver n=1 Tax=Orchesella dallaii TaxID=48710 RepID=A0ABP1QDQ9_9HEXA
MMPNSILFLFFTTVLLLSVVKGAIGIECYSCYHAEGGSLSDSDLEKIDIGGLKGHKSCKSGKTPDDTYSVSCENNSNDTVVASCAKLFYEGKIPNGTDIVFKVTLRSCFIAYTNLTQTCEDRTIFDIGSFAAAPGIKDLLEQYGSIIGNDTRGTFCSCDSDNCNTADGSKSSLFTIILLGFLLLTFNL